MDEMVLQVKKKKNCHCHAAFVSREKRQDRFQEVQDRGTNKKQK